MLVLALAALGGSTGCAGVSRRFTPEVATSFAQDDMRRMETEHLVVYYPAHARERSLEIASRLEACVVRLRNKVVSDEERPKVVVLLTSSEFNNAFVRPRVAGSPLETVIPLQMGVELFNLFDLGSTNVGDIACHEAVHYVHLEQTGGVWRVANAIFGDLVSPNILMEAWFIEGLATWLEGDLGHDSGRPHSPLWNAAFASGIASGGGDFRPGRLHPGDRELIPWGGQYLAGGHFVTWLAKTYGEDRLWELIDRQGRALLFPFGVSLRFKAVYGHTIGELVKQYEAELRERHVPRERPADQARLVDDAGFFARLATSRADGAVAVLWAGLDHPSALEIYEADGTRRFRLPLTRVLPGRPWVTRRPTSASGLSFSPDGTYVYVFSEELDHHTGSTYELRQFDARTGAHLRSWEGLRGMGGDATPDGTGYVFLQMIDGRSELARLDLQTGAVTQLTSLNTTDPLGPPAVSPDGQRIAFPRRGEHGFDLWLREADGSIRALTQDGRFNYGPHWLDERRVIHLREDDQGRAQASLTDVTDPEGTRSPRQLTNAPWAVLDAAASRDRLVFLNRDAWKWTVDAVPLNAAQENEAPTTDTPDAAPPPPPPPPPPATAQDADAHAQHDTAQLDIQQDRPYSGFDELWIPRLRGPTELGFITFGDDVHPYFSVGARGFDRLGWHTWSLNVGYHTLVGEPTFRADYGNAQLAPWFVTMTASRGAGLSILEATDEGTDDAAPPQQAELRRRDLQLIVRASRPIYSVDLGFGVEGVLRKELTDLGRDGSIDERRTLRLIGPSVSASWSAAETTPYAGARRGLSLSSSVTAYPRALGSDVDLFDLRGEAGGWIPLPLSRRHTLAVSARVRAVPGPERGLLQIGGVPAVAGRVWGADDADDPFTPTTFLPGLSFVEPARGFEDVTFRANTVGLVGARYRYPFPIDRGSTSTLWVLSSLFVRQVELEGFFEGLRTDVPDAGPVAALGGAVRLRLTYASVVPFSLVGQAAWRTRSDLPPVFVVGLSAD